MTPQELQNQIDVLTQKVQALNSQTIGVKIDPQTSAYLTKFINDLNNLLPTQTYSTSSPSGTAVVGSLWATDTGALATNTLHVWSGSAWVRIK